MTVTQQDQPIIDDLDQNFTPGEVPDIADPFDEIDREMEAAPLPEFDQPTDLPDGKYTWFTAAVRVNKIKNGDNAGRPVVSLKLCTMAGGFGGNFRGMMQEKTWFLTDERSMGFFKKDVATLGIDLAAQGIKYSQLLTTHLHLFLDRVVEGEVRRTASTKDPNNPFVNTYLNKFCPGVEIPTDLQAIAKAGGVKGGGTQGGAQGGASSPTGGVTW